MTRSRRHFAHEQLRITEAHLTSRGAIGFLDQLGDVVLTQHSSEKFEKGNDKFEMTTCLSDDFVRIFFRNCKKRHLLLP